MRGREIRIYNLHVTKKYIKYFTRREPHPCCRTRPLVYLTIKATIRPRPSEARPQRRYRRQFYLPRPPSKFPPNSNTLRRTDPNIVSPSNLRQVCTLPLRLRNYKLRDFLSAIAIATASSPNPRSSVFNGPEHGTVYPSAHSQPPCIILPPKRVATDAGLGCGSESPDLIGGKGGGGGDATTLGAR
jgi:hypothetical protein